MRHQLLTLRQQEQACGSQRHKQNKKHDHADQAATLLLFLLLALDRRLALLGLADRTLDLFLVLVVPFRLNGLFHPGRRFLRDRLLSRRTRCADRFFGHNRLLNGRRICSSFSLSSFLLSAVKLFKSLLLCSGAPAPARSGRSILQFVQI